MNGSDNGTKARRRFARRRDAKRSATADVRLAELIGTLRDELNQAAAERSNKSQVGVWREATIEVSVTLDQTESGNLGLHVLSIGGQRSQGDTARLTVKLEPPRKDELADPDGHPPRPLREKVGANKAE